MHTLQDDIDADYSLKYPGTQLIDWLRDNLWENEGTGFATEGTEGAYKTKPFEQLDAFFKSHKESILNICGMITSCHLLFI